MLDARTLADRWQTLMQRREIDGSQWLLDELIQRYAEPQRHFHKAAHLAQVLSWLEDERADDVLLLAAWFHDAVYEPGRNDNEARSAALAGARLSHLGLAEAVTARVEAAIMATASHVATQPEFAPLLDADLSILGAAPADYARYCDDIRAEFHHVPGFLFRRGRRAFLHALLARPRIFCTPRGVDRCETQARCNLGAELHRLGG